MHNSYTNVIHMHLNVRGANPCEHAAKAWCSMLYDEDSYRGVNNYLYYFFGGVPVYNHSIKL